VKWLIQNQNAVPFITEEAADVFNKLIHFSETQILIVGERNSRWDCI